MTVRSPTMVTLHVTRFVQYPSSGDCWTVKTVVGRRPSLSMIPAPGTNCVFFVVDKTEMPIALTKAVVLLSSSGLLQRLTLGSGHMSGLRASCSWQCCSRCSAVMTYTLHGHIADSPTLNLLYIHLSPRLCPSAAGCSPPSMPSIVFCLLLTC